MLSDVGTEAAALKRTADYAVADFVLLAAGTGCASGHAYEARRNSRNATAVAMRTMMAAGRPASVPKSAPVSHVGAASAGLRYTSYVGFASIPDTGMPQTLPSAQFQPACMPIMSQSEFCQNMTNTASNP